jgi:hypothetical protein
MSKHRSEVENEYLDCLSLVGLESPEPGVKAVLTGLVK